MVFDDAGDEQPGLGIADLLAGHFGCGEVGDAGLSLVGEGESVSGWNVRRLKACDVPICFVDEGGTRGEQVG